MNNKFFQFSSRFFLPSFLNKTRVTLTKLENLILRVMNILILLCNFWNSEEKNYFLNLFGQIQTTKILTKKFERQLRQKTVWYKLLNVLKLSFFLSFNLFNDFFILKCSIYKQVLKNISKICNKSYLCLVNICAS